MSCRRPQAAVVDHGGPTVDSSRGLPKPGDEANRRGATGLSRL